MNYFAMPGIKFLAPKRTFTDFETVEQAVFGYLKKKYHRKVCFDGVFMNCREAHVHYARQLCMYFMRTKTTLSFKKIGERYGGKDHTTVMHNIKTLTGYIETELETRYDIEQIESLLQ